MSENNHRFESIYTLLEKGISKEQRLENKLTRWASPPGDTEKEKFEHAVHMVKKAIAADHKLSTLNISVYAKGSFYNRTNIPADSDVDVAVVLNTLFMNDYPAGTGNSDFDFEVSNYGYDDFKKDVQNAIIKYFGSDNVTLGNKAILVHSNTVRVDADVVPHAIHRRYQTDKSYVEGVALRTAAGQKIYNWPSQDYDNGITKNKNTSQNYKSMVRILKNLRGEMEGNGYSSAKSAASYLIACLLWNVPDFYFEEPTYTKMLEDCLIYLRDQTSDLVNVKEWGEVNELKYLFRSTQPWKLEDVNKFLSDAVLYFNGLKR